jgi:aspartyl-tRNA(Asn)/glutamyl-tRNA(Gln) amidotransferase subunit A
MTHLEALAQQLTKGEVSSRALVERALDRISDPGGEGARAFVSVAADEARSQADELDRRRATGKALPRFAGIPLAIKDLFDIAGQVTRAGSRILANSPPAVSDATAIARLRAAGFVFIGRTNMTEFAYSGLGLNPHYGTPLNPFDRRTGRIPGGSTSGGGVAVADGMAPASIGTDTGGSCRIPAAFTGIVGFKPTAHRVPREGVVPLSPTLDSVGPLAHSVQCCATLDAIMSGAEPQGLSAHLTRETRLLLPTTLVLDQMDETVALVFERALDRLSRSGITIERQSVSDLARIPQVNAGGGIAAAEAYAWHRPLLERHAEAYDPRVASRILKGRDMTDASFAELRRERAALIAAVAAATTRFDALIMPTVPIVPPPLAAFHDDAEYVRLNALVLRNPSLANFLDRCSISLPIHEPGEAPVGLMLIGHHGEDSRLLALAHEIEHALRRFDRAGA